MSTTTQSEPAPPEGAGVAAAAAAGEPSPGPPAGAGPAAEASARVALAERRLPGESALQVPRDTTPTWELEMLVSGAVLYGLFQLPPLVDEGWRALLPRLATEFANSLANITYLYTKSAIYALTLTFVVHLVARAYWVALVGVDSVFPGGVRWEKTLRFGPVTRDTLRPRISALPRLISRLDNFCSLAFALGFAAASVILAILGLALAAAGVAWLVSTLLLDGRYLDVVFTVLVAAAVLPLLLLLVDARLGARLRPDSRLAGAVRTVVRANPWMLGLRARGPLHLTLSTNIPRRILRPVTFALMAISITVAMNQLYASRKGASLGLYPGLPASLAGPAGQYRYYADQRTGSDAYLAVPFIQSDMVRDPYVRLFIPYVPERDAQELTACRRARASRVPAASAPAGPAPAASAPAGRAPAASSPAGRAVGAAPAAAPTEEEIAIMCLGGMYDVKVNGQRIAGIDYRFYTDASSGLQGLLGYIPAAGLPRGGNLLTVRRPRAPDAAPREPPPAPYVIPFWL